MSGKRLVKAGRKQVLSFFPGWTTLPWNFVVFWFYGCAWSRFYGSTWTVFYSSTRFYSLQFHGFLWWIKEHRKRIKYPASWFFVFPGVEYCFCFPVLDLLFIPIALKCTDVFTVICLLPCLPNLVESSCFSERGKWCSLTCLKQRLKCSSFFSVTE